MKITAKQIFNKLLDILKKLIKLPNLTLVSGIICFLSMTFTILFVLANIDLGNEAQMDLSEFEADKIADRDITAERTVTYIDEEATNEKINARLGLVPAVFRLDAGIMEEALASWKEFCNFTWDLILNNTTAAEMVDITYHKYPHYFSRETLDKYFSDPQRDTFEVSGRKILEGILSAGVFFLHDTELGSYNPEIIELFVANNERKAVDKKNIITINDIAMVIDLETDDNYDAIGFKLIASSILRPFIRENVFFSDEDTKMRIEDAKERVEPVTITIEKGQRIIRRNFPITEQNIRELEELYASIPVNNYANRRFGLILFIVLLFVMFVFIQGKIVMGRVLTSKESCLFFIMVCIYLVGAGLMKRYVLPLSSLPVSLFFPTALMIMVLSVFMGMRLAVFMAVALPLGAFFTGFFDVYALLFAVVSGVTASTILRKAEKRMHLINAGLIVGAVNCLAVIIILLMQTADISEYLRMLAWAAVNGFISGILLLGVLPLLEHALNAATTFRLIELSDLNAPVLRKLFTTAPGTFTHSVMVATLAEQACQDIGANALLARVGGYYHDIGKMDNPDYFVENQTDHNRHDDLAPRLSATVIRSHVKIGVEKARSYGLPEDIINIISEHHGNSLIMWFYQKAAKQEDQVQSEDFTYPGSPPRSKESAIVMLADVAEAAVRTLVKPTVSKMDKFIQELFDKKVEHGQLSQSELCFRDLQTIKNAFVKVLAAYYHSRIEYPKVSADNKGEED